MAINSAPSSSTSTFSDAVNEVDSKICGKLGKTAIRSKLERMITADSLKQINDATYGTGGNALETKLENTIFNLRMMVNNIDIRMDISML
ncbi:hypothetical protein HPULCUR_004207 [Helicostylum pulchrum]|uniref:Uncharacterized protein n=1 Tax=Helicostylum pulchrum TaxID=562976 RepID=A0ABP9XVK0_9FUNG